MHVTWLIPLRLAAYLSAILAFGSCFAQVTPSESRKPVQRDIGVAPALPQLPPIAISRPEPAGRPALRLFSQILDASRTADDFRRLLASIQVGLRVKRFCFVSGTYPAKVFCTKRLDDYLRQDLGLTLIDQKLVALGLNDAFDWVGGNGGNGDLVACGGATRTSVSDMLAVRSGSRVDVSEMMIGRSANRTERARLGTRSTPAVDVSSISALSGIEADTFLMACRNQQTKGIRGGVGSSTPSDPSWTRSVRSATDAMDMLVSKCRDDGKQMISNPGVDGGDGARTAIDTPSSPESPASASTTGTPSSPESSASAPSTGDGSAPAKAKRTASEATAGVATTTLAIFDAGMAIGEAGEVVGKCTNPLKCAVAATVAVVGAVAEGAGLVTDDKTVDAIGKTADIVGGAFAFAELIGGAAGAGAVLPAIGVIGGSLALGGVIGDQIADSKWAQDIASKSGDEEFRRAAQGGGAQRPAGESGTPTCEAIATRWTRFKEYCSQPGNNWRSYDCVLFVARLNGCADPGLVNPGPEGSYVCTARCRDANCQREQAEAACEITRKWRDMISNPGTEGSSLSCSDRFGATFDLESKMRDRLCESAVDIGGDLCAAARVRKRGSAF